MDLSRYEFNPAIPVTGPHILLGWYERNEGNHLFVARTVKSLEIMVRGLLAKEPDAELTKQYVGNIVLPPDDLRRKVETARYDHDVKSFKHWFLFEAKKYQERIGHLPKGLEPCAVYISRYYDPENPEDSPPDDYEVENHSSCLNCDGDRVIYTGDYRDLFEAKGKLYNDGYPKTWKTPRPVLEGLPADPGLPLLVVTGDFGPHRGGTLLEEVSDHHVTSTWNYTHSYPNCFFQGTEVEVDPALKAVVAQYQDAQKARKEMAKAVVTARRQGQDIQQMARLRALFED